MSTELLWPPNPAFTTHTERVVWEALRDQLGPSDLLIANQRFITHEREYELDLAVVLDGYGVVVLEVKGGKVWFERGEWWQMGKAGPHRVDPVAQAIRNKHTLRDWVEMHPAWVGHGRVRWAHGVVFPSIDIDLKFALPDLSRQMVIGRNDLSDIASKVRTIPQVYDASPRPTRAADAFAIHSALEGRFTPTRGTLDLDPAAADERAEVVERLSAEQGVLLDVISMVNRVEVRGGAGSGKTWLAVEQARRLAQQGERVALLCYSRGLAAWLRRHVDGLPENQRPAYVGTFHGMGRTWGAPDGTDDNSAFWETELPALMVDLAQDLPDETKFDSIVIDEAQDFADNWWPAVLESLRYQDGGLYVFSDEGQRIFSRFGNAPAGLVPLVLERNLRNTRQISETFTAMAPNRLRPSEHDGPEVRFVQAVREIALDAADDAIDGLLDEGWNPGDIALLATDRRHPEQSARQEDGQDAYWDSFWDGDQVFYGHVLGFKGLERPVVVLAVNEAAGMDRARERLYVGLSRARDLLVVVGDLDQLEATGGAELAEQLRKGAVTP